MRRRLAEGQKWGPELIEDILIAEALTAEDGLDVFRKEDPDLVLVDLMMEEVDAGTSFVKEMKALGMFQDAPGIPRVIAGEDRHGDRPYFPLTI